MDTSGVFIFENLAESNYNLRIIPYLDDYDVMDKFDISVTSEDTIDLGLLELQFNGIPTPKNLIADYDTLSNNVKLTWNTEDSSLVKGYRIYRKIGTSGNYSYVSDSIIIDTFFIDDLSNGLEKGEKYQYNVRALDKNENEGKFSFPVIVDIAYYILCLAGATRN